MLNGTLLNQQTTLRVGRSEEKPQIHSCILEGLAKKSGLREGWGPFKRCFTDENNMSKQSRNISDVLVNYDPYGASSYLFIFVILDLWETLLSAR
jgi:hypothetical protein